MDKLRKFLKERGYKSIKGHKVAFNRYNKIKRSRSFVTNIDDEKKALIAEKKGDRLILRDYNTLEKLATTKKFNLKNIDLAWKQKKVNNKFPVLLKYTRSIPLTKKIERYYSKPKRKDFGQIHVSITFTRGHQSMTVKGGSRRQRYLINLQEQARAFDEAFQGALSKINFSYERFTLNWMYFVYYDDLK